MNIHHYFLSFISVVCVWGFASVTPANAACSYNFNTYNVKVNQSSERFPTTTVSPGAQITIELPFWLSNAEACPGCIRQIVIGVERDAKYCAYNGIPKLCTDGFTEGSNTGSFSAPMAPGRYIIYAFDAAHLSCGIALANYPDQGGADVTGPFARHEEAIGEIIVIDESIYTAVMDIKPGSCVNPLNTSSRGVLPVALLGGHDFDVTRVNIDTLRLEGVEPVRYSYEDVAGPDDCYMSYDGYQDLALKFSTQSLVNVLGPVSIGDEVKLTLTGELNDGTAFEAYDVVIIRK